MLKYLRDRDVLSGFLFLVIGCGGIYFVPTPIGSAARMGPGFLPLLLSGGLVLLGLVIGAGGVVKQIEPVRVDELKPLFFVLLAVVLFALLVDTAGLLVAGSALLLTAMLGGPEFRLTEALAVTAILVALCGGLFILGLGLPIRFFPAF